MEGEEGGFHTGCFALSNNQRRKTDRVGINPNINPPVTDHRFDNRMWLERALLVTSEQLTRKLSLVQVAARRGKEKGQVDSFAFFPPNSIKLISFFFWLIFHISLWEQFGRTNRTALFWFVGWSKNIKYNQNKKHYGSPIPSDLEVVHALCCRSH